VAKLIVEDVGPERPENISSGFTQRAQRDAQGWASEKELLQTLRQPGSRVTEDMLQEWIPHETKRREDGRVVWKYDPSIAKGFVPTELCEYVRRIQAPTLYVLGGNSSIVPQAAQERLKATLPMSRSSRCRMPAIIRGWTHPRSISRSSGGS
jgi:pimeloyl-ACP methyl ester carboxylesterase